MSGVKPITSYFKVLTKDELEIEELEESQSSSLSRVISNQSARTCSTLSTKVYDTYIDLTKEPEEPMPALADYSSDDDDVIPVAATVGDSIFSALDRALGPEPLVFSSYQTHCKKRDIREYNSRPVNWTEIADYYKINRNVSGTLFHFGLNKKSSDKNITTKNYWITTLGRWMKDCETEKFQQLSGRLPVYGTKIDLQLVALVQNYSDHAVPMTNSMLRMNLITMLTADNRKDILDAIADTEEPLSKTKKYRFADQWALRFYKRHKLSSRVATTKMRDELPAEYEVKVAKFKLILSLNIHQHNMDETNTLFVPQIPRTRCKQGTRRVRLVGVGKDKAQVTTTPTVTAEGDVVLPTQVIFGRKTKRCHPNAGKGPVRNDIYFDNNSTSHWQTPETMIRYVSKVLVPYRLATIDRLSLPADQKTILILDLHYSHKDAAVLAHMRENNILPVYIPAGCTDLHQVCDVVINKPYKNGDYVTGKFCEFNQRPDPQPKDVFQLNMAGSVMKPLIPEYVLRGMAAVGTPAMKVAIKECFYQASFVGEARQLETYEKAKLEYPNPVEEIPIPEGGEAEEDLGPIADDSPPNGAVDGDGIFDVEVREDEAEVAEDPRELLEEDGPEEEKADEPVVAAEPRKKRQKRTPVLPADSGSSSNLNVVSRSGRPLNPSTLHGGILPSRYSTIN